MFKSAYSILVIPYITIYILYVYVYTVTEGRFEQIITLMFISINFTVVTFIDSVIYMTWMTEVCSVFFLGKFSKYIFTRVACLIVLDTIQ